MKRNQLFGIYATFSDKHGLIVYGGYDTKTHQDVNSCNQLSFTAITDDWK